LVSLPEHFLNEWFICIADEECADFEVKCGGLSPTVSCVDQDLMCDGEDDCGNNWDEHPQTCGQF